MRVERLKDSLVVISFWALTCAVSLVILAVFALYAETPMDGYKKAGRWDATLTITGRTLPEASGLETGDRIISIDGARLSQRAIEKPIKLFAGLKTLKSSAQYEIERNGQAMMVEVPLHKMGWGRVLAIGGIHPLLALFYIITASIMFLHSGHSRKPDSSTFYQSRSLRVIAYALVFGAANIVLGTDLSVRSGAEWLGSFMTPWPLTSGFAFGLMLHFLLTFPPRDNLFTRSRWAVYALHGSYLSLATVSTIFFLRTKSVPWLLSQTRFVMIAVFILSSAVAAFLSHNRATCPVKKNQMKSLAWGVSLGIGPWFFVYLIPSLVGIRPFIDHRVVMLFLAFIPISLLIAISRYKLLEIDRLIRRSLVYTVAMALMTGAYLIAFASVTRFIEIRAGISDPVTPAVLSALLLALAFNPLRVMSERLVEKLFYRGSVNTREAFSKLSLEINQVIT